ncbi:hypothetical protein [Brumicola blandensis]|uniref:Uncharacterized protein n=1 Tax=Brumicola blandensis TaxID=3075611 RepID=A0AAW8R4J7_9ALTE|nr:hypothetical protein [Alteromonas sp. W409]MDT0584216.1 hypothetical protein [Alteromonas sp. W409]
MSEMEIKAIINRYRNRAIGLLSIFSVTGIIFDYLLKVSIINSRFELDLSPPEFGSDSAVILVILGLYVVLFLCFDAYQKILLTLFAVK